MAKIKLSEGFQRISEGEHTFRITGSDYKEKFGKLEISMISETTGEEHKDTYALKRNDGTWNTGAQKALTWFVRKVLDDYSLEEVDPDELDGVRFLANVTHEVSPSTKDPDKTYTNVRLEVLESLVDSDIDAAVEAQAAPAQNTASDDDFDLDDLLGE